MLPAGYATTGVLGLLTARAGIAVPIALLSAGITAISCWRMPNWRELSIKAWTCLQQDWQQAWASNNGEKRSMVNILVMACVLAIYVLSIGPINQPDAADYHAGYAHQFFLRHRYHADGGLTQGLMGLGDFSHLSNFQENTTWLIRSTQILPLLPLVLLLKRTKVRGTWILAFVSAPLFIGWASVGKPMFLGESCIAAGYLLWRSKPSKARGALLLSSLLIGVSLKISAAITIIPIVIDLAYEWVTRLKKPKVSSSKIGASFILLVVMSAMGLAILLADRWFNTGNPAFPLLSKLFTPNNIEALEFENYLKGFGRDDSGFPLTLFIPLRAGNLASVLGPATGIIALMSIALFPFKNNLQKRITLIGTAQVILLALLGQWRADYYSAPIILLIASGQGSLNPSGTKTLFKMACRVFFNCALGAQLTVFIAMASMSIYQSVHALTNYTSAMNQWAYGFEASQELMKHKKPYLNLAMRETRLYYDTNYIDPSGYRHCLRAGNALATGNGKQLEAESCFAAVGAKTVMAEHGTFQNSSNLQCFPKTVYLGQRNLFNNRKIIVDICNVRESN